MQRYPRASRPLITGSIRPAAWDGNARNLRERFELSNSLSTTHEARFRKSWLAVFATRPRAVSRCSRTRSDRLFREQERIKRNGQGRKKRYARMTLRLNARKSRCESCERLYRAFLPPFLLRSLRFFLALPFSSTFLPCALLALSFCSSFFLPLTGAFISFFTPSALRARSFFLSFLSSSLRVQTVPLSLSISPVRSLPSPAPPLAPPLRLARLSPSCFYFSPKQTSRWKRRAGG